MTGPATNRAERLRLHDRLDLADRAVALLRSKEDVLRREESRLRGHVERTGAQWARSLEEATTWLLRARALGAGDHLGAGSGPGRPEVPATVELDWQRSMGVGYPGEVVARPGRGGPPVGTAALAPAASVFGRALEAGARHAAAGTAHQRVEQELLATRRRRRSLDRRLRPRLVAEIHRLDLALDERERDAALRVRLATAGGEVAP